MKLLKFVLLCGVIYFLLVSVTNIMHIRFPLLSLYFNLPSNMYEQNVVAAFALICAAFFISAALQPTKQLVLTLLLGSAASLGVLVYSNMTTHFEAFEKSADLRWYYMQTAVFQLYWFGLLLSYNRVLRRKEL